MDRRIIDYKKLNDQRRKNALSSFLQFCDNLNGLVLTILFNKNTNSIFESEFPEYFEKHMKVWKKNEVREKFLRLREIIVTILNGVGRQSQKICWITDNDDIVSNDSQLKVANEIMKETLGKQLDFEISDFELNTTSTDSSDRILEKFCSLADLCAGGLVDFVGDYNKTGI